MRLEDLIVIVMLAELAMIQDTSPITRLRIA
jgi:hypothetical protein